MRILLFVFTLLFGIAAHAQQWDEAKLSNTLIEQLRSGNQSHIEVLVMLNDQVDIMAMQDRFRSQRLSRAKRVEQMVGALQNKAERTQGSLMNLIERSGGAKAGTVYSLWITNMIGLAGTSELIAQLSQLEAVEWIDVQREASVGGAGKMERLPAPFVQPNGTEPGLLAINADKLWAMGYTGYGRNALIIDTGTEGDHPALRDNYRGIYVPDDEAWTGSADRPEDCEAHGTHVSGTVCGIDRLTNDTIGVAFNALWMAAPLFQLRDCPNSIGNLNVFQTFQWALNPDGNFTTTDDMPDVINGSWGFDVDGSECSGTWVNTFNAMETAGIAVVLSAGNEGPGPSTLRAPGNVNFDILKSFTVAAVDGNTSSLNIAGFSSRGPAICSGTGSRRIKPEVAAPGVNVRSSIPGGYGLNSGTSMAAPHVAGAILLLGEAFPQLEGRDYQMALYQTCRDLGAAGEDNDYGRGIIDVLAAYNYLIDQGNTPVDPRVNNDALIVEVLYNAVACFQDGLELEVTIENSGENELTAAELSYTISDAAQTSGTFEWSGSLNKGERATFKTLISNAGLSEGSYDLAVEIVGANGTSDARRFNNVHRSEILLQDDARLSNPIATTIDMGEACENSPVLLQSNYSGNGTVQWFDVQTGGDALGTGDSYLTPPLTESQTFYMDVIQSAKVGKETKDSGIDRLDDELNAGLVFNATTPFTLKTVKVFAEEIGIRVIALTDLDGNVFGQKIINIRAGESRIDLNLEVPAREGMVLQLTQGRGLYTNITNPGFPHSIDGLLSIIQSRSPAGGNTRYYYFYDWEIEHGDVCGRGAVTVDVSTSTMPPEAAFASSTNSIDLDNEDGMVSFTDQSNNATQWLWAFGNGDTSTEQNPSYTFEEPGTYVVSQTVINADGCTDAAADTIEVTGTIVSTLEEGRDYRLSLQPNPAKDLLFIQLNMDQPREIEVEFVNALGQRIRYFKEGNTAELSREINVAELSRGIYFVVFHLEGSKVVKKLILTD
ncbi:MAG: S8 family serine peptidase [Bacteroidota bacterium]